MVHELGICVFVCIFAASLCAFEGILMCIWGYKAKKIIVVYVIWNVVKKHCNIFLIYVLLVPAKISNVFTVMVDFAA